MGCVKSTLSTAALYSNSHEMPQTLNNPKPSQTGSIVENDVKGIGI